MLLGFQIPRYLQKKHKEGEWMVRTEAMQEVREGRWDKAGRKSEIKTVMMGWEALITAATAASQGGKVTVL